MFKKGDVAVKIINCAGIETASFIQVKAVSKKKGVAFLGDDRDAEAGVQTYALDTGLPVASYLPGVSTRIVPLDDYGKDVKKVLSSVCE